MNQMTTIPYSKSKNSLYVGGGETKNKNMVKNVEGSVRERRYKVPSTSWECPEECLSLSVWID